MGAVKQVFKKVATERQRRKFYRLCDALEIEQELIEPPSAVNGNERFAAAIHLESDEFEELNAIVQFFGVFRAGAARLAFRLGMETLVAKINVLYPQEDDDQETQ